MTSFSVIILLFFFYNLRNLNSTRSTLVQYQTNMFLWVMCRMEIYSVISSNSFCLSPLQWRHMLGFFFSNFDKKYQNVISRKTGILWKEQNVLNVAWPTRPCLCQWVDWHHTPDPGPDYTGKNIAYSYRNNNRGFRLSQNRLDGLVKGCISPVRWQWRYCSLALSHWSAIYNPMQFSVQNTKTVKTAIRRGRRLLDTDTGHW